MSFIKMTQEELDIFYSKACSLEETDPPFGENKKNSKRVIINDEIKKIRYCLNLKTDKDTIPDFITVVEKSEQSDMTNKLKVRFRKLKKSIIS
jgi:hypothetical protein